ncbi:MAG: protein-disulfide reductase DsbD domain-containing protein, partial [Terriglobia bacterium]
MSSKNHLFRLLCTLLLAVLTWSACGSARGEAQLLQATQAFRLSARVGPPGTLRLHWDIAPHYYLYRGRIQVQPKDAAAHLGKLSLPDGLKEHDPYLGDVEIYHDALDTT